MKAFVETIFLQLAKTEVRGTISYFVLNCPLILLYCFILCTKSLKTRYACWNQIKLSCTFVLQVSNFCATIRFRRSISDYSSVNPLASPWRIPHFVRHRAPQIGTLLRGLTECLA